MHIESTLAQLIGEPIGAIAFVTDYVELDFNGPIFRCIAHPTLVCGAARFSFPGPGSRDALCSLIGDHPVSVEAIDDVSITLRMSGGCELTVPLDAEHARGGESAHFVPGLNKPIHVW